MKSILIGISVGMVTMMLAFELGYHYPNLLDFMEVHNYG